MSDTEPLIHQFRTKDGTLSCRRCGTVWGDGTIDCFDPYAERMRALRAEAEQIAARPDVGEPEVRRLEEILAEQQQILEDSGVTAVEEARAFARRLHPGRGHAVDLLPPSPTLLPPSATLHVGMSRPDGTTPLHIHWA